MVTVASSSPMPLLSSNWIVNSKMFLPTTNTSCSSEFRSIPPASLSSGLTNQAVGPSKSTLSTAPRSLNTLGPWPVGDSVLGSSIRNWPNKSNSGARIGDSGIPKGSLTVAKSGRSSKALMELSIARDPLAK